MAIRHLTDDSTGERDSIKSRINDLLPDNNSGRISAADIRVNLEDIVDSILENVADEIKMNLQILYLYSSLFHLLS